MDTIATMLWLYAAMTLATFLMGTFLRFQQADAKATLEHVRHCVVEGCCADASRIHRLAEKVSWTGFKIHPSFGLLVTCMIAGLVYARDWPMIYLRLYTNKLLKRRRPCR